ncbi:MAG: ABC transporter permease [Lachnospiraceae bacterium]|nr:ABC transporter permease [Lachnospiraceae bacterium]
MRVFKTYFLILNRYKGTVFLYFAVFLSLALIMAKVNGADTEKAFEQERLDVAIVNEDRGSFGEDVKEYFGSYNDITTMEYDEEKIANALYWKRLDYVLVIPDGFSKELENGKLTDLSCVRVPGYFDSVYFESELQMYLQKLQLLVQNGYTLQEAQKELMKLQEQETKVTLASFVNEKQGDINTHFFLYVPYLFIAVGVAGIGLVLLRLNGREVKERTECGALPMRSRVGGMVAAIAVFGILLYVLVLVIDVILSKGSILQDMRLPWFLLNMFAMLLFGMSLGFFAGMVAKNVDAMNAIVNVVSLVLCFLGGIFVPREWFAGGIGKIAKLVPTYWYVVNNEEIGQMTKATSAFVKNMLIQSGIVIAYAVVFFAVTLVIISARRKRTA